MFQWWVLTTPRALFPHQSREPRLDWACSLTVSTLGSQVWKARKAAQQPLHRGWVLHWAACAHPRSTPLRLQRQLDSTMNSALLFMAACRVHHTLRMLCQRWKSTVSVNIRTLGLFSTAPENSITLPYSVRLTDWSCKDQCFFPFLYFPKKGPKLLYSDHGPLLTNLWGHWLYQAWLLEKCYKVHSDQKWMYILLKWIFNYLWTKS